MSTTLVNVADRADQTRYLVAPVEFTDSTGASLTVAAAGTDTATTQALANSLRSQLIALGLVVAA